MTMLGPSRRWLSGLTIADPVADGPGRRGRRVGGLAVGLVMMTAMLPAQAAAAVEVGHWLGAAPLPMSRGEAVAVALPDGRVLVASGNAGPRGSAPVADSRIYDPVSDTWSSAAPIPVPRVGAVAAPLPGGKVLVTGGNGDPPSAAGVFGDSQIYDPASDSWSPAAAMPLGRELATAAPLPGGRVLVTGGSSGYANRTADSQVYDPVSDTWSVAAPLPAGRVGAVAASLPGGKVLVSGGLVDGEFSADSRTYDPATDSWTLAAPQPTARFSAVVAVLADGGVFVTGGYGASGPLPRSSHVYDAVSDSWSEVAPTTPRASAMAAPLPGGRVLVTGGSGSDGFVGPSAIYVPTAAEPLVSMTTPSDGAAFAVGSVPDAEFRCQAGAGGALRPGTAGCAASIDGGSPVASGAPLASAVGEHTVVVTATQTDGHQTSATHRYTVSVLPPTLSITTPPDGAAFAVGSVPDAEFSCQAGAGGALRPGTAGCAASIDGGSPVASGTPLASAVGEHTVVVTATQTDGQEVSVTRDYRVVVGAPEVSITTPQDGASYVAGSVPDAEFSCTAGAGGALVPGTNGCHVVIDLQPPALASGAPLVDTVGTHSITATAVGADGSRTSVVHHYTVTPGRPQAVIVTPEDGASYVHGSVPASWVGCGPGLGGVLKPGVEGCAVSIDGGPPVRLDAPLAATVGPHTITATATGVDGQQASVTHRYTVTAGPPAVSVTTPEDGATYRYGSVPGAEFSCTVGAGGTLDPGIDGCSASIDGGPAVADASPLAGEVGSHSVVVTATGVDGQQTSATHSYTVNKADQTIEITSAAPTSASVGGAPYLVSAAATSGLPVSVSIDPSASSVCAIDGVTVTFTGVGTCTINVDQAGDDNYNAAPRVTQALRVEKAPTTLVVGPGTKHLLLPSVTLTATLIRTDSEAPIAGQPITFRIGSDRVCGATTGPDGVARCEGSVGLLTFLFADRYTAGYAGGANHQPATGTGTFGPLLLTAAAG